MSRRGRAAHRWALVIATTLWGAPGALAAPAERSPFEPPPIEVPPIPALADPVVAPASPAIEPAPPAPPERRSRPRAPRRRLDPAPVLIGASLENRDRESRPPAAWRQVALVSATAAAGVALAAGAAATYIATEKTTEFNTRRAPPSGDATMLGESCGVERPGAGPPGCAELLSDREQALRWGRSASRRRGCSR